MERCPNCRNRGGLEYGCLGDQCDMYLFGECSKKSCWYCADCETVALSEKDVTTDAFGDLEDAFDGALSVEDILNYNADR